MLESGQRRVSWRMLPLLMPIPEKLAGSVVLRRYRLDGVLSSGGMGVLYRATHLHTGREVALKFLLDAGRHGGERFAIEARAAAELKHPNVVEVIDMDQDEHGAACIVLELLEGRSLAAVLEEQGRLSAEQCAQWLLPIMGALALAHDRGILHRDLKPANIFIATKPDGSTVPKLLDFGIAKLKSQPSFTMTGAILGTPSYMSPEQARGDRELLQASDVWGMGVIWFRCLTGRLPFEHETPMGTLMRIVNERAPRIESACSELPRAFGWAVDRALQKEPSARYADMRAFARALLAAGLQDNLTLPAEPDPIGLPDWSTWLTCDQDLSSTGTMSAVVPAPIETAPTMIGPVARPATAEGFPTDGIQERETRPPTKGLTRLVAAICIAALVAWWGVRWGTAPAASPSPQIQTPPLPSQAKPANAASKAEPVAAPPTPQGHGVSQSLQEDEF